MINNKSSRSSVNIIPQDAKPVLEFNKILSSEFSVEISVIDDSDPYIVLRDMEEIAMSLGKVFAVAEIRRIRHAIALDDMTKYHFEILPSKDLTKMTWTAPIHNEPDDEEKDLVWYRRDHDG